jgi:hypothetical protein
MVHGAEMEEDAPSLPGRGKGELAAIAKGLPGLKWVAHA